MLTLTMTGLSVKAKDSVVSGDGYKVAFSIFTRSVFGRLRVLIPVEHHLHQLV